jgi:hypothetical protein
VKALALTLLAVAAMLTSASPAAANSTHARKPYPASKLVVCAIQDGGIVPNRTVSVRNDQAVAGHWYGKTLVCKYGTFRPYGGSRECLGEGIAGRIFYTTC